MKEEKPKFIYFRENYKQSIIADVVTFGLLFALLVGNYKLLRGDWYVTIFIMALILIVASAKGSKKKREFYSKEELIDYLNKPE